MAAVFPFDRERQQCGGCGRPVDLYGMSGVVVVVGCSESGLQMYMI